MQHQTAEPFNRSTRLSSKLEYEGVATLYGVGDIVRTLLAQLGLNEAEG